MIGKDRIKKRDRQKLNNFRSVLERERERQSERQVKKVGESECLLGWVGKQVYKSDYSV